MKWLAFTALMGVPSLLATTDPTNPWAAFGQLGAAGILAAVLYAQLQKAEKRADAAEARTIAALQETVPVLALATERLSDKVTTDSKITPDDVRLQLILDRIDKKLGGG